MIFVWCEKTRKWHFFKTRFFSLCASLGFVRIFTFHDFDAFLRIFSAFVICQFLQGHNQKHVIFDDFWLFFTVFSLIFWLGWVCGRKMMKKACHFWEVDFKIRLRLFTFYTFWWFSQYFLRNFAKSTDWCFCQFSLRFFIAHTFLHMLFWRFWHVFDWLLVIFGLAQTWPCHIFSFRTLKNSSKMLFWHFCQFLLSHFLTLFCNFSSFFTHFHDLDIFWTQLFSRDFDVHAFLSKKRKSDFFMHFSSFLPVLTLNDPPKSCLGPLARP